MTNQISHTSTMDIKMAGRPVTDAEASLARRLAHTEKETRDTAFETVRTWFMTFTAADGEAEKLEIAKMWKALFYCVWMSDKTPVQQELISSVAELVDLMAAAPKMRARGVQYLQAFSATMRREWGGLDRYRLDKYMSLIRRMLSATFRFIKTVKFQGEHSDALVVMLTDLMQVRPNGIRLHLADIYSEELASALPDVTTAQFLYVLAPVLSVLRQCDEPSVFSRVVKEVWTEGIVQGKKKGGKGEQYCNVDFAEVARMLFGIAGHPDTRADHLSPLYALHKRLAAIAVAAARPGEEVNVYGDVAALQAQAAVKGKRKAEDMVASMAKKKAKLAAAASKPSKRAAELTEEDEEEDNDADAEEDDEDMDMDEEDEDDSDEEPPARVQPKAATRPWQKGGAAPQANAPKSRGLPMHSAKGRVAGKASKQVSFASAVDKPVVPAKKWLKKMPGSSGLRATSVKPKMDGKRGHGKRR